MIYSLRRARADDEPFLWEMLFEAAAVDAQTRALGREKALGLAANRKYLEGWGRAGDAGLVASDEAGERLGAAWYRLFGEGARGYGFVSERVPELTIAVVERARGRGVGRALLMALMDVARESGFAALSLSVDRNSRALSFYERLGFNDAGLSGKEDSSVTLLARL